MARTIKKSKGRLIFEVKYFTQKAKIWGEKNSDQY